MWPFKRKESSTDYSSHVLDATMSEASGVGAGRDFVAAVVACSNFWANKFLQINYEGPPEITISHRMRMARDYVELGHSRFYLDEKGNYIPIISATKIQKGWMITIPDDHQTRSLSVLDAEVLNIVFRPNRARPHEGVPLGKSSTGRLSQGLDNFMADESCGPSGKFLWINHLTHADEDFRRKVRRGFTQMFSFASANKARGKFSVLLNPAPSGKDQQTEISRIGPHWEDSLEKTRAQLYKEIASQRGVPVELLIGGSAASSREGNRIFALTAQGICDFISFHLTEFTGKKVKLDARSLFKLDLISRSRAVGSLTKSGMPLDRALEICGFET